MAIVVPRGAVAVGELDEIVPRVGPLVVALLVRSRQAPVLPSPTRRCRRDAVGQVVRGRFLGVRLGEEIGVIRIGHDHILLLRQSEVFDLIREIIIRSHYRASGEDARTTMLIAAVTTGLPLPQPSPGGSIEIRRERIATMASSGIEQQHRRIDHIARQARTATRREICLVDDLSLDHLLQHILHGHDAHDRLLLRGPGAIPHAFECLEWIGCDDSEVAVSLLEEREQVHQVDVWLHTKRLTKLQILDHHIVDGIDLIIKTRVRQRQSRREKERWGGSYHDEFLDEDVAHDVLLVVSLVDGDPREAAVQDVVQTLLV